MRNEFDVNKSQSELLLPIDALLRSLKARWNVPHTFFLGAGASISSGIPSAQECIWQWKKEIYRSNNPKLNDQFLELSMPHVRDQIQQWLDKQEKYPLLDSQEEYGFYIEECYPHIDDRKSYFKDKIKSVSPQVGYHILCQLFKAGFVDSVWTTNFDGITAKVAQKYSIIPYEVGMDSSKRLEQFFRRDELLTVSVHGDYRYDPILNTDNEIQNNEKSLFDALKTNLHERPLIVVGYSGRDQSVMNALNDVYSNPGKGSIYWCGYSDSKIPNSVEDLLKTARGSGKQAHFVPTNGFDDLMIRIATHSLTGDLLESTQKIISDFSSVSVLDRKPFHISKTPNFKFIKSNAFELICPTEIYSFKLKTWPEQGRWNYLRQLSKNKKLVTVPFKDIVFSIGTIEEINDTFVNNIDGEINLTSVYQDELKFENGAITNLMRLALIRSIADSVNLSTDGKFELWHKNSLESDNSHSIKINLHESMLIQIRAINGKQYMCIEPSIKMIREDGGEIPTKVNNSIKSQKLSSQYNNAYSETLNNWRKILLLDKNIYKTGKFVDFEFPANNNSEFKFQICKFPIFSRIYLNKNYGNIKVPTNINQMLKFEGTEVQEPNLVFSSVDGTKKVYDVNSIRGIKENRPFDFPLTERNLSSSIRFGIICPKNEQNYLLNNLQKINGNYTPGKYEHDHLLEYSGFQNLYGVQVELPDPETSGWYYCPEPTGTSIQEKTRELARRIELGLDALQSTYSPDLVIVYIPDRWSPFENFRNEVESFDVHDKVKSYAVQRGIFTQFLKDKTFTSNQRCRVWWWLSLAIYSKRRLIPWTLRDLNEDTVFVGLGYSLDKYEDKNNPIVLGCSHIYSPEGIGLQFRLSKIEKPKFRQINPLIRQKTPFMSKEDSKQFGENIRRLFFEKSSKLPERVVIHKRTPFLQREQEGLAEGLAGVQKIDMLEIQWESCLRYVISKSSGSEPDLFPVNRGTILKLSDYEALLWVHGSTVALNNEKFRYFQGKRRIPSPVLIRRYVGDTSIDQITSEILGLSKMNWNSFDQYSKLPVTLETPAKIAKIGKYFSDFDNQSYDYRLFI